MYPEGALMDSIGNAPREDGEDKQLNMSDEDKDPDQDQEVLQYPKNIHQIQLHILPAASKDPCTPEQLTEAAKYAIRNTPAPNIYYTDGSLDRAIPAAAAAVVSPSGYRENWRLSNHASTLQTELVAIAKALEHSANLQYGNTTIHTDSRGAILALSNKETTENVYLITVIQFLALAHQSSNRKVTLNWVPSHIGISSNDEADHLAKSALICQTISITLQPSLKTIKNQMAAYCNIQKTSEVRQAFLDGSRSAKWYFEATNILPHPIARQTPRQDSVIICRLRLGYLCSWQIILDNGEDPATQHRPIRPCNYCDQDTEEPLQHYLLHCQETSLLRQDLNPNNPATATAIVRHIIANVDALSAFLRSYPPPR
ncbi:uncharacterized protein [Palaemon carinicauda]|uniref:uncharacterized protein n=1 Tax=Palaemon carinicauda TaxID=392227 RepID=UPI0035B5837C